MKFDGVFKPFMKGNFFIPIIGDGSIEIDRHGIGVNAFWIKFPLFRAAVLTLCLLIDMSVDLYDSHRKVYLIGIKEVILDNVLTISFKVFMLLMFFILYKKGGRNILNHYHKCFVVWFFWLALTDWTSHINVLGWLLFRKLYILVKLYDLLNPIRLAYAYLFYYFFFTPGLRPSPDLKRPLAFCIPWKNIKEIRKSKKEKDKSVIIFIEDFDFRQPLIMSYNNKCVLNFYPSQGVENFLEHYNYIVATLEQSASDEDGK